MKLKTHLNPASYYSHFATEGGFEMGFSTGKLAWLLAGWLGTTNILILLGQLTDAWPLKVLAFLCISLLPGLALLRAMGVKLGSPLEVLLFSFGLSVLILMLSGLAANEILYLVGVSRPLELASIWSVWNVATIACIAAGVWRNREALHLKRPPSWLPKPSKTTAVFLAASALLPILAALGAFRLNNGGDALVAGGTLVWAAGLIMYAFIFRNRLTDSTLAWCIFTIGLAILLMTSLRSWDISGHDIMREFRVYTLAHSLGHWDIGAYRDPYNACLSVTILPEMYAKLLNVSGLIVFKLILQIIFAVCPVVLFITLRRYASKIGAFAGCVLFISYPTFINDSAMLTRQGVAYLFFALALLAAIRSRGEKLHKWLFLLCAVGVVLSHYSTSYMFVALFAIALTIKLCVQGARGWRLQWRGGQFTVVSPAMLVVLTIAVFLWYGQFTATSKGLAVTISRSLANIPHLLSDDNKSADTSSALLLSSHKTQADIYQEYLVNPVSSSKTANALQYQPALTADNIPLTKYGERLKNIGIEPAIIYDMRQNFAKLLQLLAVVGVLYITYRSVFRVTYLFARKKPTMLPLDLLCFSLAGITILILMVILPTISLNYGVLRAFQQSLIFLLIPLIIWLSILGRLLYPWLRTTVATISIAVLFLLFTGSFAQLFGGVGASLTLNNRGLYYGLYYTTAADLSAYQWMKTEIPKGREVHAASFSKAIMHNPDYPFDQVGVLPAQMPQGGYAYLDHAQSVAHKFYVYHDGSPLIMTFPLDYYQDWTDQIYSTTTTGVYR